MIWKGKIDEEMSDYLPYISIMIQIYFQKLKDVLFLYNIKIIDLFSLKCNF